jgi:hypothetical protein
MGFLPGWSDLLLFITAALILLFIPGPAVLYIVARSVEQGRRAGLASASGIAPERWHMFWPQRLGSRRCCFLQRLLIRW